MSLFFSPFGLNEQIVFASMRRCAWHVNVFVCVCACVCMAFGQLSMAIMFIDCFFLLCSALWVSAFSVRNIVIWHIEWLSPVPVVSRCIVEHVLEWNHNRLYLNATCFIVYCCTSHTTNIFVFDSVTIFRSLFSLQHFHIRCAYCNVLVFRW